MTARVSVIVPAYNASSTIRATLDSIQAQSFADIEIFVVDDGSKDDTADIADAYARSDGRLRVIRQANAGVAAARNAGLQRASGEFVAWLDADDVWHPTKLEKQLATIAGSSTPLSFVYSGYRLIDEDGVIQRNFRPLVDVSGRTYLRQLATNHFSNVSSIMAPRKLTQQIGGHDPRLRAGGIEGAEDFLLQLQLAAHGPVACVREALVGYRMHRHNMSLDHWRAARSNLKAIELAAADAPAPDWVISLGEARTAGYALHLLRVGDGVRAAALAFELMRKHPMHTALTLALIARWQIPALIGQDPTRDPAVGQRFVDADPATAPWRDHLGLSKRHSRQLIDADAAFQPDNSFHQKDGGVATQHAAA